MHAILLAFACCVILSAACMESREPVSIEPVDLSGMSDESGGFAKYYASPALEFVPRVPSYNLPLATGDIANYRDLSSKIALDPASLALLEENGFVVIENPYNPREEDITRPYQALKEHDLPIFITTDSLLHLYHIQFDETLRQIEEREFYDAVWQLSDRLLASSLETFEAASGEEKEAARRNAAFFAVGLALLEPGADQLCTGENAWQCQETHFSPEEADQYRFTVPAPVRSEVEKERALIENHEGFSLSPVFHYEEDYSQYVPRGHYTRSEKLKNYFRAMMWYGRMSFLLKGGTPEALVSAEDARIQTAGAAQITAAVSADPAVRDLWDRIYTVTAFYVGYSDDLGPYEYRDAMSEVFGDTFDPVHVSAEEIDALKAELAAFPSPRIYGGTGNCAIPPPYSPEQADQCLESTKGFRLMGQRFVPDSYIFTNLVGPYAGNYMGSHDPFTRVGPIRGFPMGLDVMALLGSERAREILEETENDNYERYAASYADLEEEFGNFSVADWNQNLYWSWLYALKPLLSGFGPGYPTFMQGSAWQEKELSTALASWTELRHDTILYAKQSYTMKATAIMPEEEYPVVGYVEPVPEFYHRLLALTRMTNSGLEEMGVLDGVSKDRLARLGEILFRLETLSIAELEDKELTGDDYEFIRNFGSELEGVIAEVDEKARKTTIVADVHTDANSGMVLEEGVGYVDLIIVAYRLPDGRILCGAGPVMSYYEFKHPMDDRLTDEKWRGVLSTDPPDRPAWTKGYSS